MPNFLQTENPTGMVSNLVTSNGKETVISAPAPGGTGGGPIPALPAVSHMVFVSTDWGSDVTGDGSMGAPYETIAHAQSTITTAAAGSEWSIVLFPGMYIEAVALQAFVRIVGWDPSCYKNASVNEERPAIIVGAITLGASMADADAIAVITNCALRSTVTIDFVTLAAATGQVAFTNCSFSSYTFLPLLTTNKVQMYACIFEGGASCTITGGIVEWYNTSSPASYLTLSIGAGVGQDCDFSAYGGGWLGSVQLSQNGQDAPLVNVRFQGFVTGFVTKTGTAVNQPTVFAPWGAVPENVAMSGASYMNEQMRVFQQLVVPSGVPIGAAGTTDVVIALAAGTLGETDIASIVCLCSMVGPLWHPVLIAQDASVTWTFEKTAGTNNIHCLIYTPGAGFITGAGLVFNFYAWRPG